MHGVTHTHYPNLQWRGANPTTNDVWTESVGVWGLCYLWSQAVAGGWGL